MPSRGTSARAATRSGKFPPLWAEWNGRYRDTVRRYWKGDDGQLAELGYRLTGQQRPVSARRPPSLREHQFHHRARRLHAERSGQLQRKAQRGQRRGQPRRRQRQPLVQLRRGRSHRRPRDHRNARAAEAQFPATLLLLARRADDLRRRRDRPHAEGNNNAYAQDNEISWFDWNLDERKQGAARVHAPAGGNPPRSIPTCTAANSSRIAASILPPSDRKRWTAKRAGHHLVPARRRR